MLAEILAYSKSALCRSASLAFSFVSLRLNSFHLFIVDSVTLKTKRFIYKMHFLFKWGASGGLF